MFTYLVGPFITLLPSRWRDAFGRFKGPQWRMAAVLSGLAESAIALAGLSYWYTHAMEAWTSNAVDSALSGKLGPGVTPDQIGAVAFSVWITHPLTLLLAYAGLEGAIRLCAAAFSDQILGTLPLALLDKAVFGLFRRNPSASNSSSGSAGVSSAIGAVRERAMVASLGVVADELSFNRAASEDILEVYACRRKDGWNPPKTVRFEDAYFRLESDSVGSGPRPYRYLLKRLPVGVPGRSVLLYAPVDPLIRHAGERAEAKANR